MSTTTNRPRAERRSPARATPASRVHQPTAARMAGTRCPPSRHRSPRPSHDRVPATTQSPRGRRSSPTTTARSDAADPSGTSIFAPDSRTRTPPPTPRSRAKCARHRPRSHRRPRNRQPRPDQPLGPRAITPSQLTVSAVEPAKPGSDSQPLTEHSQPRSQRSPEHRNLHPNRTNLAQQHQHVGMVRSCHPRRACHGSVPLPRCRRVGAASVPSH